MDMIIAPLPFRRQKGASIVVHRAEACGVVSRRDSGATLGQRASGSWMGIVDGRRTDDRASEREGLNERIF